ncbi:MAG TPA: SusD/RagB family nutrient-binding outer membrane lipoprotein [Longimicrobiales bacterium]|nr:SusD/RagB family nutrient-binding outer membrane lipoprotein [Longimicrobiales bacterium]
MTKRFLKAVPALALFAVLGACDEGLTEINQNPNAPEDVPPANLLGNAIMDAVGGAYGSHSEWFGMYLSNLWSQHLAQPTYGTEDDYLPRIAQLNGVWESAYTGPLADLNVLRNMAAASGDENLDAVSNILMHWQFQILTDVYGSIPYTEALRADEGINSPAYDSQETVYNGIFDNLEAAVAQIDPSASVSWAGGDFFYNGDLEKWTKFANSLRMRAAMRLSEVAPATAEAEFAAAYAAGGFESNADNAVLQYGATGPSRNPIHLHFTSRPLADFAVSKAMVDTLMNNDDPRLPFYADPAPALGTYNGLPNGFEATELPSPTNPHPDSVAGFPHFSPISTYYREPDAPAFVFTYAEVLLLQAEAAERGWIAADAESLWQQGIEASMEQYNIPQAEIDAYIAGLTYNGLESIWTQQWIALYLNGNEAWSLVRRTGHPVLTPADGAAEIPGRLPISPNENLYNPDNYAAFADLTVFDPVWWDVN